MRRCVALTYGLVALAAFGGCSKREPPVRPASAKASASFAKRTSPPSSEPSSAQALDEAAVRRLLDAWLAAQNASDFAAYEKLYGERFTGVKRSGVSTRRFARAGWLADRKLMFEKPMNVSMTGISVVLAGGAARVEFEQAWSSGSYSDTGPKQMVVVLAPAGPRIAREEMLASRLAGTSVAATLSNFVLADEDGLVLHAAPEDGWAKGEVAPGRSEDIAMSPVDEASLPPELRAWKGRSIYAVSASGALCMSTVTSLVIRSEVVPHFGMRQEWHGTIPDDDASAPLSAKQIAREVWELGASGGRSLVGVLSPPCAALFALDAAVGKPSPGSVSRAGAELEAAGLAAFRRLPAYAEIQRDYAHEVVGAKGPWDRHPQAVVRAWSLLVSGAPELLMVTAVTAIGGCDEFTGMLDAVFRVGPGKKPALTLVGVPELPNGTNWTPESVFDVDGDGAAEILLGGGFGRTRGLYSKVADDYELRRLFEVPYLDCPC